MEQLEAKENMLHLLMQMMAYVMEIFYQKPMIKPQKNLGKKLILYIIKHVDA